MENPKNRKMKYIRIFVTSILFMLLCCPAFAYDKYDFIVDGIRYHILDNNTKEVEVINALDSDNEWVGYDGDVVIPSTVLYQGIKYKVVAIGNSAFAEEEQDWNFPIRSSLNSVTISEGVKYIGSRAFSDCVVLKKVVLPSTITSIGQYAFYECRQMESIEIPNSVKKIDEGTFYFCKGLKTIIMGDIESIGSSAFGVCSNLESFNIPESVTSIGERAFSDCGNLIEVIANIKKPFSLGNNAFVNIASNAILKVPYGTKTKYQQYKWNNYFKDIVEIGGPVTYVLSVTSKGNGTATYNGASVRGKTSTFTVNEGTSATISFTPDNGNRIKSVKLINTDVTSIVSNNSYTIGGINSDTSMEVVFEAIPSIISFSDPNVKSLCVTNWDTDGDGELSEAEAAKVTNMGTTFKNNNRIASFDELQYFTNLRSINDNSFQNCVNLTSIKLPVSVTTIGDYAFLQAKSLKSVNIPSAVSYIGLDAFEGCANLEKVIVPDIAAFCKIEFEKADDSYGNPIGFAHHLYKDENTEYTELVIPETVKSIPWFHFCQCYSFKSIVLPNFVTSIGSGAFDGCKNVKSIVLSNSLTIIPPFAFGDCTSLETLEIPNSVTSIGYAAFKGCTNLSSVVLPKSLTSFSYTEHGYAEVNGGAFEDCSKLSYVKSEIENPCYINTNSYNKNVFKGISSNAILEVPAGTKEQYLEKKWMNSFGKLREQGLFFYKLSIKSTGSGVTYCNGENNVNADYLIQENSKVNIAISPNNGYRLKRMRLNSEDVTNDVNNNIYTIDNISACTSIEVEYEAIPKHFLRLLISGNGNVAFNGVTLRNQSTEFEMYEGTTEILSLSPDAGYRLSQVNVNGQDVSAQVIENQLKLVILEDVNINIVFEEIPIITHTLTISTKGNGSVIFNGSSIKNNGNSFAIVEGDNAIISLTPDKGCRIKSVKLNNIEVTESVNNNQYVINDIKNDNTLEVEFEAIIHTMAIKSTGNGMASYNGMAVRGQTNLFTVTEGSNATVTFIPDNGYRIKNVKVDGMDVTTIVTNSQYTIRNINKATSLEVEFEEIPPVMFTLSITSKGNGSASCEDTMVRGKTNVFTVTAGASALVTFSSDEGYRILSVKLNGADITANVFNNQYTIVNIGHDTSLEVEFAENVTGLTQNGINYKVVSYIDATLNLASGDYGLTLSIPATISAKNRQWKVVGVESNALNNCSELAAIEWNPDAKFNGSVGNPNLLLYVKKNEFASDAIQNVVVNDEAEEIVLQETGDGNNFYCPKAFTAKKVLYEHNYSMKSGYNTCQGWETIVLPFDVTKIQKQNGTELLPYQAWMQGSNQRPFWLYSLTELGWKTESSITANTPYIISMPNNEMYNSSYNISGIVQFIGTNVQIKASKNLGYGKEGNKKLMPNYQNKEASPEFFVLNVNNRWNSNTDAAVEGSVFVGGLRQIHPFEAYMTIDGNAARNRIPIFRDDVTGMPVIPMTAETSADVIYNLNGQRVRSMSHGIYIKNGKKVSIH